MQIFTPENKGDTQGDNEVVAPTSPLATNNRTSFTFVSQSDIDPYIAYRNKVETIQNDNLKNTVQYHRLNKDMEKITGICNLCAMETLLNRKVAYGLGDYSNPYNDYRMFETLGVKDLGNGPYEYAPGKLGYYLSGSVGDAQEALYRYSDGISFQAVCLGAGAVTELINATGKTGLEAQYEAIANLLMEHPEGIWIHTSYNSHAIVITDYVIDKGQIRLYGIDSVDVRKGRGRSPIEQLYFYRTNYSNGVIGGMSGQKYRINIAYLVQEGDGETHVGQPDFDYGKLSPSISISGNNVPDVVDLGTNFGIRGTVKTDVGILTNIHGAIIDSSGIKVQSCDFYPSSSSADLRSTVNKELMFGKLLAGNYTYLISARAKNGAYETEMVLIEHFFRVDDPSQNTPAPTQATEQATEPIVEQPPVLNITEQRYPSDLSVGDNFGIRGIISTDYGIITEVQGKVLDSFGNIVLHAGCFPNMEQHDLRYSINNELAFGKLQAGNYTYIVTATAQNGSKTTTKTLIETAFRVNSVSIPTEAPTQATEPPREEESPSLSISGQNYPSIQEKGSNFGIRGIISASCGVITEVQGKILDSSGNVVFRTEYYPETKEHDLRYSINKDLTFGMLAEGNYTYYVYAVALNGSKSSSAVLINTPFTVTAVSTSSDSAEPAMDDLGKNMIVNVGQGSTLRFCSTVSVADAYEIGSIPNNTTVWVYGITKQKYEDRIWARISYNGTDGWVNYKWLS